MKRRVAITGIGAVSSLGVNVEEAWCRLKEGRQGITRVEFQGYEAFPHCFCGGIRNFEPSSAVSNKKLLKLMNRESQFAFCAAQEAIADAGVTDTCAPERIGIFLGTGLTTGELESLVPIVENSTDAAGGFSHRLLGTQALAKCNPLLSFKILPNMALSYISIEHGIRGPNMAMNPWPGNAAQAIIEAMRSVQTGETEWAVAGGCDSKCNAISFLTLSRLGLLSKSGASRARAVDADGMIPGEGAACLVLESFEHAQARGAAIYAELCGGASMTDAVSRSLYPEDADCLEETMRDALTDANVARPEVGLIATSLNGHPQGDETEMCAIDRLFYRRDITLAALSESTGELAAASPAFALAMCARACAPKAEGVPRFLQSPPGRSASAILINSFALGPAKASLVIRHGAHD